MGLVTDLRVWSHVNIWLMWSISFTQRHAVAHAVALPNTSNSFHLLHVQIIWLVVIPEYYMIFPQVHFKAADAGFFKGGPDRGSTL